ncbi:hypothetical protein ACFV9C_42255 [Kribbella sp. NPDC059898]|uniref:hypothetical protein n=1 Tax=Kribbella sp. NPDC059898 TaxID=3346995 RepID=UPI0036545D6E
MSDELPPDHRILEHERRQAAWLLDWRDEIDGVERYAKTPVQQFEQARIAPENVVGRLGPELTAMARFARREWATAVRMRANPAIADKDVECWNNRAWGACDLLALGLGVHLDLPYAEAMWLAEGLTGYEIGATLTQGPPREGPVTRA